MLQIYKASAGSGKTFTLAYEYIKLLLGQKDEEGRYRLNKNPRETHRAILGITFTNKATEEMKRRIVHELAVLAEAEPGWTGASPYAPKLIKLFGCSADELKRSARLALQRLLFDFNFFHISTIDSFFQTILRTFAREAELTGNYELELAGESMVNEGVQRMLTSLSTSPDDPETKKIVNLLTAWMLERLNNSKSANILNKDSKIYTDVISLIGMLNDENVAMDPRMTAFLTDDSRLEQFADGMRKHMAILAAEARRAATECRDIIAARGLIDSKAVQRHLISAIEKEAEGIATDGTTVPAVDADIDKAYSAAYNKRRAAAPDPETDNAIARFAGAVVARNRAATTFAPILDNLVPLSLMGKVMRHIEEYRTENNALLLSDTGSLLRSIIGDDDAPFVYERMGIWLNHFLIDEFQDTSRMQWEILRPLVGEGLSHGHDNLIIGDEKQCIYRFRNSDPTLLAETVGSDFDGLTVALGGSDESNTNWRSSADVVRFNNDLFAQMAADVEMGEIYSNVRQRVSPTHEDHRGYIRVRRLAATKKDEARAESLQNLAADIARQLRAGYRPADIAVLTRTGTEARQVISYLLELQMADADYPRFGIISDDAMSLIVSPAVKIIINELRLYSERAGGKKQSGQTARTERLIHEFERGVANGLSPEDSLHHAVAEARTDSEATPREIGQQTAWSLPSLVESIAAMTLPEEMLATQHAFISAFLDVVQEFCSRFTADLNDFLRWWDDNGWKRTVSAPADTSAIRVMTIHKSKGLEFPCVHLPHLDWDVVKFLSPEWVPTDGLTIPGLDDSCIPPLVIMRPTRSTATTAFADHYNRRVAEQRLDELNTLYVAFTRAVDELCVSYMIGKTSKGNDSSSETAGRMVGRAIEGAFGIRLEPGNEWTVGEPTQPRARKEEKLTAVDPRTTSAMPPFRTLSRPELWEGILLDDSPDA